MDVREKARGVLKKEVMAVKKKWIVASVAVVVLVAVILFVVNYMRINAKYPDPEVLCFQIGETVDMEGYEFTLTSLKLEGEERARELVPGYVDAIDAEGNPEELKLLLVAIHIKKTTDEDSVLDLTRVCAESKAWGNGSDFELYLALNQGVGLSNVQLLEGEEIDVVFPFTMVRSQFREKEWEQVEERKFYAVLNWYPQKVMLGGDLEK